MNTGEKIKQHRLVKKISPKDLAEVLGMDVSNYYRIERDEIKPDIENLMKIADYMKIDPNELLSDDKFVFNISSNTNVSYQHLGGNINPVINTDQKLVEVLEDKIKLMDEKMQLIITENTRLKEENELLKGKIR